MILSNIEDLESKSEGFMYCGIMSLLALIHGLLHHYEFFVAMRVGWNAREATFGAIYRNAIRMSTHSAVSTGQLINLASSDVERFVVAGSYLPFLILSPLQLAVIVYLMYRLLGPAGIVGVGVLCLAIPVQWLASQIFARLRAKTAVVTDSRVKATNELISGIRLLKMYCWERPFVALVAALRKKEISFVRRANLIKAANMAFFFVAPALTSFVTFLTFELIESTDNVLTARKVFQSMALLSIARLNMTLFFPNAVQGFSEVRVSVQRLTQLMTHINQPSGANIAQSKPTLAVPVKGAAVQDLHCHWTTGHTVLKDITFDCTAPGIYGVVGQVGSGKSSLLYALLGELPAVSGAVVVTGTVSYSAQQPWIQGNLTIKENILFGRPYDQHRYQRVLAACQLTKDMEQLTAGDDTMVGERGVTLSGGQKARVSLARAIYRPADIYLLDDPLSAVDAAVGKALYEQVFQDFLLDKVVILATHQVQYLTQATRILVLSVDGHQEACDTYPALLAKGWNPQELVAEVQILAPATTAAPQKIQGVVLATPKAEPQVRREEAVQTGSVRASTYIEYARAGASVGALVLLLVLCILTQASNLVTDWFLSYWVELAPAERHEDRNLGVYGALVAGLVCLGVLRSFAFFVILLASTRELHNRMLHSVAFAPIQFFDANPVGRILNRFSKDLGYMDDLLPW